MNMEVGMLPSQFLNVILEESYKNNSAAINDLHLSRNLPSSLTISPVLSKPPTLQVPKDDEKYSTRNESLKLANGLARKNDYLALKKRLPRTVLEECIVEFASDGKRCNTVPESCKDAIIIEPMYARTAKKPRSNERNNNEDLPDIFNQVEVVYSDEEEPSNMKEANGSSPFAFSSETMLELFACEHCPNKYTNKGALWQHNVAVHSVEKSCECRLCGRKFYRNCSLALHMKCHSDEQNCSCKICGKEFNRLSMLERHAKCHTVEFPPVGAVLFACNICSKKFNDEPTLRLHISTHSEKFTCDQCNVTFSTKQLLDLHFIITHKRSETPFACKLCKARFANLRELNEHSLSHSFEKSRISCHHCGEVFTQRSMYKKHLQLHMGERLSCTICKIDFTQRSSLLRHYKRLHLLSDISLIPDSRESSKLIVIN